MPARAGAEGAPRLQLPAVVTIAAMLAGTAGPCGAAQPSVAEVRASSAAYAGGMVADCLGAGVGTDSSPALAQAVRAWVRAGDGARLEIPAGRYCLSSPLDVDLGGRSGLTFDASAALLTPAAKAMRVLNFHNGRRLTVKANFKDGGRYAPSSPQRFYADYGETAEVVAGGGQEAIAVSGVYDYHVELTAENYAGRLLRVTRARAGEPPTAMISGSIRTTRGTDLSKPRTAQALWADSGAGGFTPGFGTLDFLRSDFDAYGPVWTDLNDVGVTYLEGAYGYSGVEMRGVGAVKIADAYVGDIDSGPAAGARHFTFAPSPDGRLGYDLQIGRLTMLNRGDGLVVIRTDGAFPAAGVGTVVAVGGGAPFGTAVRIDGASGVRIGAIVGHGAGATLLDVAGAATDDIDVGVDGWMLRPTACQVTVQGDVRGKVTLRGGVGAPAAGGAAVCVAGGASVDLRDFDARGSGSSAVIDAAGRSNRVRWLSGRRIGGIAIQAREAPAFVSPDVVSY